MVPAIASGFVGPVGASCRRWTMNLQERRREVFILAMVVLDIDADLLVL